MNGSASGNAHPISLKRGEENVPVMRLNKDGSVDAVFVDKDNKKVYKSKEHLESMKSCVKASGASTKILDEVISVLLQVKSTWVNLLENQTELSM